MPDLFGKLKVRVAPVQHQDHSHVFASTQRSTVSQSTGSNFVLQPALACSETTLQSQSTSNSVGTSGKPRRTCELAGVVWKSGCRLEPCRRPVRDPDEEGRHAWQPHHATVRCRRPKLGQILAPIIVLGQMNLLNKAFELPPSGGSPSEQPAPMRVSVSRTWNPAHVHVTSYRVDAILHIVRPAGQSYPPGAWRGSQEIPVKSRRWKR